MSPGMSGLEMIKKYSEKSNFPFILYYAGEKEIGEEAVREGAYAYVLKPNTKDLMTVLRNIISE